MAGRHERAQHGDEVRHVVAPNQARRISQSLRDARCSSSAEEARRNSPRHTQRRKRCFEAHQLSIADNLGCKHLIAASVGDESLCIALVHSVTVSCSSAGDTVQTSASLFARILQGYELHVSQRMQPSGSPGRSNPRGRCDGCNPRPRSRSTIKAIRPWC